jgi:maltooligosyltrehalose synthase
VGDSPGYFGIKTKTFHNYMEERLEKQPMTMNAISTHDSKRGEDARARLNVLSDIPEKWMEATKQWRKINQQFKQFQHEKEVPVPNDEYLIYQVLCAHLPMSAAIDDSFISRLEAYLVKAMREAKVNSSWSDPDEAYENGTLQFVRKILSPQSEFPKSFLLFMEELIPHGMINSVSQLILKNLVPGVPDTFQGTEEWNLSFVDPDNRRPVDFEKLSVDLDWIIKNYQNDAASLAEGLWQQAMDGQLKQWINWLTLQERIQHENLFLKGTYLPLEVIGKYRKNIIAFYRNYHDQHLVAVLPLNTASLPVESVWEDSWIKLPGNAPRHWENRLTKNRMEISEKLPVSDVFSVVPFGILRNCFD